MKTIARLFCCLTFAAALASGQNNRLIFKDIDKIKEPAIKEVMHYLVDAAYAARPAFQALQVSVVQAQAKPNDPQLVALVVDRNRAMAALAKALNAQREALRQTVEEFADDLPADDKRFYSLFVSSTESQVNKYFLAVAGANKLVEASWLEIFGQPMPGIGRGEAIRRLKAKPPDPPKDLKPIAKLRTPEHCSGVFCLLEISQKLLLNFFVGYCIISERTKEADLCDMPGC